MSGAFRVLCEDALAGMQSLPEQSVDAVIMDPPYASGGFTETARRQGRGQGVRSDRVGKVDYFDGDNMGTSGLVWLLRSVAFEAVRVLRPRRSVIAFCDWRQVANLAPAMESAGLRHTNIIVWDKGAIGPGSGFRAQHEMALHYTNGAAEYFARDVANVIRCGRVHSGTREHFAQKPVELMRAVVRTVCPEGGTVVDPFCGSGSTGVAAVLEGRQFIGFDRDERYCAIARQRMAGAPLDLPLAPRAAELIDDCGEKVAAGMVDLAHG